MKTPEQEPIDFELAYGEIYKDQRAALAEALAQPSDSVEQEPVNVVLDSWDAWASSTEYDNRNHDLLEALKDIKEALALTSTPCEVQPESEAHLQAVSDFGQLQAQIEERNFCSRCGKRLMSALGPVSLHTCCPPNGRTFDDYGNKIV